MNQVQAIAVVMAVVQFLKKWLPNVIQGAVATTLTLVMSLAVTLFKFLSEGLPLNAGAIAFFFEVVVGAMGGYGLLKVAGGSQNDQD